MREAGWRGDDSASCKHLEHPQVCFRKREGTSPDRLVSVWWCKKKKKKKREEDRSCVAPELVIHTTQLSRAPLDSRSSPL